MESNYDILELFSKVEKQDKEIAELKAVVATMQEMLIDPEKKAQMDVVEDMEGFWTITEILRFYGYSEQYFYKLKKLIPLKTAGKRSKQYRYNKKNVLKWGKKIELLKISNPELFQINFKKAS